MVEIGALDLLAQAEQSAVVQAAALGPVPTDRLAVLTRHTAYPSFAAFGAFEAGRLVGYTYGARCQFGQWWFDQIAPAISAAGHDPWLVDVHAVTELHVLPSHQGRGIGFGLVRALLAGVAASRVVLSTYDNESVARRFYRRLGFVDLLADFRFEVTSQPFALMGAFLPLAAASSATARSASPKSETRSMDRPTLGGYLSRG